MLTYSRTQYSQTTFLSIVTRKYKRPKGLERNLGSIEALNDKDIEQIFITDHCGLGLLSANTSFGNPEVRELITGKYVFLLDDDDFIINPAMVELLKAVPGNPDVICFRMIIKNNMNGNYYPTTELCWGNRPIIARIGGSCFVVKREVYLKYIHEFAKPRCGDYSFINAIFEAGHSFHWLDILMCETGKVSRGAAE